MGVSVYVMVSVVIVGVNSVIVGVTADSVMGSAEILGVSVYKSVV